MLRFTGVAGVAGDFDEVVGLDWPGLAWIGLDWIDWLGMGLVG